MMTFQIKAPHFTAGLVSVRGKVTVAAPIVAFMHQWPLPRVVEYCQKKGWELEAT